MARDSSAFFIALSNVDLFNWLFADRVQRVILILHSTEIDGFKIDFANGRIPRGSIIDLSIGEVGHGRPLCVADQFRRGFARGMFDARRDVKRI